jgi:hypothetical protein
MEAVMNRKTLAVLTGSMLIGLGSPAVQAQTLYRSVGPDGKVTFSDTPPPPSVNAEIAGSTATGSAVIVGSTLPYELQQIASRYPGHALHRRQLRPLRQRAQPSERQVEFRSPSAQSTRPKMSPRCSA